MNNPKKQNENKNEKMTTKNLDKLIELSEAEFLKLVEKVKEWRNCNGYINGEKTKFVYGSIDKFRIEFYENDYSGVTGSINYTPSLDSDSFEWYRNKKMNEVYKNLLSKSKKINGFNITNLKNEERREAILEAKKLIK